MNGLAVFLIFSIGILDTLIFIFSFRDPQFMKTTMIIHIILYFAIYFLEKKYLKQPKGIPTYLVLFLPGLGGMIISFLYLSSYYILKDSMILEEYEQYIHYKKWVDDRKKIDYRREVSTISFSDQMELLNEEAKKDTIIDFNMEYYYGKTNLLQKGLLDQELEVRHYTAVTINMIENEFTAKINYLKEEYNLKKDIRVLEKLSKLYKDYIETGLLSGEVLRRINQEYIYGLNILLESKKEKIEIMNELIKGYICVNNFKEAEAINEKLRQKHKGEFDYTFNQMHIAYKKRDFNKLRKLTVKLNNEKDNIPEKYRRKLTYWIE